MLIINKSNKKVEDNQLIEVTYSNSSDSNGNVDNISLNITKKIITTQYKAIHSDPLKTKTYKVSDKDINKIVSMIKDYKLINYTDLPIDTDLIAMDAPSTSLGLVYKTIDSKEWHSISYNSKFPKGAFDKVKEVSNYLISLTKDEKNKE